MEKISIKTEWDYSERAATYDQRADYSYKALESLVHAIKPDLGIPVADIGAGTGKLTKLLLDYGFTVHCVEPNQNMRDKEFEIPEVKVFIGMSGQESKPPYQAIITKLFFLALPSTLSMLKRHSTKLPGYLYPQAILFVCGTTETWKMKLNPK